MIATAKKLKILRPVLLAFGFYGFIRNVSLGIHAKTSIGCFIAGMTNYLGIAYLSRIINIPQRIYNVIFAYCFFIYAMYAPSGTAVNPVYKEDYIPYKTASLLIIAVYCFIGNKMKSLRNIVTLAAFSQSLSIIPFTYKIFKQKGGIIDDSRE